jgi:hypothetical protein
MVKIPTKITAIVSQSWLDVDFYRVRTYRRLTTIFFSIFLGLVVPPASSSGPRINVVARKEVETVTPAKSVDNEEEDKNKEVELI